MDTKLFLTNDEMAALCRVDPKSLHQALCRKGHWHGLRPVKLPGSNRLLWPRRDVAALLLEMGIEVASEK